MCAYVVRWTPPLVHSMIWIMVFWLCDVWLFVAHATRWVVPLTLKIMILFDMWFVAHFNLKKEMVWCILLCILMLSNKVTCFQKLAIFTDRFFINSVLAYILLTCLTQLECYATYEAFKLLPSSSSFFLRFGFLLVSEWHQEL